MNSYIFKLKDDKKQRREAKWNEESKLMLYMDFFWLYL